MADLFFLLVLSPILVGVFRYCAYLAWFRKNQFRNLSKAHSERYHEWPLGRFLTSWEPKESYFWFARLVSVFALVVSLFIFVISYGAVLLAIVKLLAP